MATFATFTGPNGANPSTAIRATVAALKTPTVGDLLYVGEGYRSRIRERTFAGIDVNGAPFAPYSTKGPFYLYVNREATSGKGLSKADAHQARATASENRHKSIGRIGVRTATGIRYESYATAHAAHGSPGVTLYGMEQHPHMLDVIMVKAGGSESAGGMGGLDLGSEFEAFEQGQPCTTLSLGFYGDEEGRAKGNNEGTSKIPKREFFALNAADLGWGEKAIGERMAIRASRSEGGPAGGGSASAPTGGASSGDRSDWISF